MSAVPRYLQRARQALQVSSPLPSEDSGCERSEKSEKRARFQPGQRYTVRGPVIGIIHRTDDAFESWRRQMALPRAGIMTIEGERVIVADVRAALRTGVVDIVGVKKEETA